MEWNGIEWNVVEGTGLAGKLFSCLFCWNGMALLHERTCSIWWSKLFPVSVPFQAWGGGGGGGVDYPIHFPAQSDSFQVLNYALSYRTTACEQGLRYSPIITTAKLFKS